MYSYQIYNKEKLRETDISKKKKLIITLLFVVLFSCFYHSTGAETKENMIKRSQLIKRLLKPGKITAIKAEVLKKILIGEWELIPPELVIFKEDGTFRVFDYEIKNSTSYRGQWGVRDNAITFKVEGAKEWQMCKILYIKYKTCIPNCPQGIASPNNLYFKLEKVIIKADYVKKPFLDEGFYNSFM